MLETYIAFSLGLFGLILGSFAGATVWRLRARQLLFDKTHKEPVDKKEWKKLEPLTKQTLRNDRSRCLHCGYALRWYDLVPLVSWLSLKGKCRECRTPIGAFEPLMEVGMAVLFVGSYLLWPMPLETTLQIALLATWLVACVGLMILLAYDAKWFLLPDGVTLFVGIVALVGVGLTAAISGDVAGTLLTTLGAVGILSGIYLLLYLVSGGRWIGFGDVKLGLVLGLLLADWQLGFLTLFLANFIGCLVVIPLMAKGKLTRTSHVPFGPFLIVGTVIAQLVGLGVIDWYMTAFI